jgi:IMP dehydrogenase
MKCVQWLRDQGEKFTFDDILLVPDYSEEDVRETDSATKATFFNYNIPIPVISSPMETITGIKMMSAMWDNGAIGVHHRYCDWSVLEEAMNYPGGIAVSPSMDIDKIVNLGHRFPENFFVIDVAQGHTKKVLTFCKDLIASGIKNIVSGNIATVFAAYEYLNVGVRYLRVGVGGGSRCLTRVVTGFGYPQASAVNDIYKDMSSVHYDDVVIISDGGCKNTGDMIKAYALGASFVMSGYLFAGTDEVPEKPIQNGEDSFAYRYSGMASKEALEPRKSEYFVEGDSIYVAPKGSVGGVLEEIEKAIKNACHYGGVTNYRDLVTVDKIRITENSFAEGMSRR